jgi:type I restriction enzyme S subunit
MCEWRVVRLGDIVEIKHGYAFRGEYFSDRGPGPLLMTPGNFAIGGGFQVGRPKFYLGPVPEGFYLKPGDLTVTMTDLSKLGDTLGYPALVPASPQYLHNQRIGRVLILNSTCVDKAFLYYALHTANYRHYVLAGATGSTVRHTSPAKICDYRFMLPPIKVQKGISTLLSALDGKIAVNERIAAASEELLRTRFKQAHQATMEMRPIGALGSLIRTSVTTEELLSNENYIGLEHMPRRSVWLNTWAFASSTMSHKNRFRRGDILFGRLRPYFHKVGIAQIDGVCSTDILVVRPRAGFLRSWLLFTLSSDEVIAFATAISDGTRMPRVGWRDLATYGTPWPGDVTVHQFEDVAKPLMEYVERANQESRMLVDLRDTLLPRLVSGELDMSDAEKVVEETV